MADPDWRALIESASAPGEDVTGVTFVRKWPTYSQPVAVGCDDGSTYVVKALRNNHDMSKSIFNERVVGTLGRLLGAPIPELRLVELPQELIDAEPEMQHMLAGVAHGSSLVPNCSDRLPNIAEPNGKRNKKAYARLGLLYGWVPAGDHQLVSTLDAARDLYSVDHGHFFAGGPDWTDATLAAAAPPAVDAQFAPYVAENDLEEALDDFRSVDNEAIASAVASAPDSWGVPIDERVTVAKYLATRRDTLIRLLEEN